MISDRTHLSYYPRSGSYRTIFQVFPRTTSPLGAAEPRLRRVAGCHRASSGPRRVPYQERGRRSTAAAARARSSGRTTDAAAAAAATRTPYTLGATTAGRKSLVHAVQSHNCCSTDRAVRRLPSPPSPVRSLGLRPNARHSSSRRVPCSCAVCRCSGFRSARDKPADPATGLCDFFRSVAVNNRNRYRPENR